MKTVLITGAAGGLGVSLVREYLSRGYRVFGADCVRGPETGELLAEAGENYLFIETDVTDPADSARGIADIAEGLRGRPDRYMFWNYNGTERPW